MILDETTSKDDLRPKKEHWAAATMLEIIRPYADYN